MLGSETMKRRCEWQTCRYSTSCASSLPPFPLLLPCWQLHCRQMPLTSKHPPCWLQQPSPTAFLPLCHWHLCLSPSPHSLLPAHLSLRSCIHFYCQQFYFDSLLAQAARKNSNKMVLQNKWRLYSSTPTSRQTDKQTDRQAA